MVGIEKFTQRARRVLSYSHQEAERRYSQKIETEHILLGLMQEDGGLGGRALKELGLTTQRIKEVLTILQPIELRRQSFDSSQIGLSDDVDKVIEFTEDESLRLGHHYSGTEHLLLALIRVDGNASKILRLLNVSPDSIRAKIHQISSESVDSSPTLAQQQVDQTKGKTFDTKSKSELDQIFVVHGHDNELKETVARFIERLGFTAVILNEQASHGRTIIEKFESFAEKAAFAIVLLTPDDIASSRSDAKAKKFRARQNVIYELGFFNGKLGRNRVCALYKSDSKEGIELPSDFLGIVYVSVDSAGAWRIHLAKEMKNVGLKIDLEKIL